MNGPVTSLLRSGRERGEPAAGRKRATNPEGGRLWRDLHLEARKVVYFASVGRDQDRGPRIDRRAVSGDGTGLSERCFTL